MVEVFCVGNFCSSRMIKIIILKRVFLCQEDDVQYMLALRYVGIRRTRLITTFLSILN